MDSGTRGGRGRGHGRGRGRGKSIGGGMDIVPGNALKGRNTTRSSSETRLPPDSIQLQHHESGNESAPPLSQQYHHQNSGPLPSSFQEATRPRDEPPREYHRRSNSKCVCVCVNLNMLRDFILIGSIIDYAGVFKEVCLDYIYVSHQSEPRLSVLVHLRFQAFDFSFQ